MKNILVVCYAPSSFDQALSPVKDRVNIVKRTTQSEIKTIKTLDDLSVYDLIIIGPINHRIYATSSSLAVHFRERFDGPIIAIGSFGEWRDYLEDTGCCTQIFASEDKAAAFIRETLFPTT